MKKCPKCLEIKEDSLFGKSHPHCRECKNKAEKQRRLKNLEKIRAYDRARYHYSRRRDRIEYCALYNRTCGAIAKRKNSGYVKHRPSTPETRIEISESEFNSLRSVASERRSGLQTKIRRKLKNAFRSFLFLRKKSKWKHLIGEDCNFVRKVLEEKFIEGMTWDNHGKYWHIDHYVPVSFFDLNDDEQAKIAFNWRNIRPLKAEENLKKSYNPPPDARQFIEKIKSEMLNE